MQTGRKRKTHCSGCGVRKTKKNCHVRRVSGTDYWCAFCRKCSVRRTKAWRSVNVESYLYSGCKSRAKRQGVPFNLTKDDISIPERCPVLNIPLFVRAGGRTDNTPTVDRIVPSRGYVRGNVEIISWRANRLKNNASADELRKIAAFVSSRVPQQS